MADGVETVDRSTWIAGDLKAAPTALLVLAALTLTPPDQTPTSTSTSAGA